VLEKDVLTRLARIDVRALLARCPSRPVLPQLRAAYRSLLLHSKPALPGRRDRVLVQPPLVWDWIDWGPLPPSTP